MPSTTQAISLGVVVLFVAFLFPTLISAPSSGESINDVTISATGENVQVGEALNILLEGKSGGSVTLNITSLVSGNATSLTVVEGDSGTVTLDNASVTVRVLNVESGSDGDVDLEVRYPSNFAWSDQATALSDELPIAVVAVGLFVVVAFIGAVVPR